MQTLLRAYRSDDIDALTAIANNERVSRYLIDTFPYPYTREDASWWIDSGAAQHGAITRAIEHDGRLVGTIGVAPQHGWRAHIAEIGYWLGEHYWGRGIASDALRLMSQHAFEELGYRKLIAPVLAPNGASMRVLEKCGYTKEGILKEEVCKHDRYYDIHLYALLAGRDS